MKYVKFLIMYVFVVTVSGCASPPSSDPSKVEPSCAQQCSSNLATCSSGFKFFPVVQQSQCNDNYDVCIKGCPARTDNASDPKSTSERLKKVEELFKSGVITKDEYEAKRNEILKSI